MKKLIFILFTFFISFGAYCQTKYTLPYDSVIVMRPSYSGYLRGAKAGFLDTLFLVKLKFTDGNQSSGFVITSDANGNGHWAAPASGGSSNTNVGTGFRWAIPTTNQVKTFLSGYGLILDSATSNTLRAKVDTLSIATIAQLQHRIDSLSSSITPYPGDSPDRINGTATGAVNGDMDGSNFKISNVNRFSVTNSTYPSGLIYMLNDRVIIGDNDGLVNGTTFTVDDGDQLGTFNGANGIVYASDISATFVDLSLINKGYANKIIGIPVITLTDGATIAWDANNGTGAQVVLTGDHVLSISNSTAGQMFVLTVIQDGTGGHVLSTPGGFLPSLNTGANDTTVIVGYRTINNWTWRSEADVPSLNVVDTIWRTPGVDSIKFSINNRSYAIKDSIGGASDPTKHIEINDPLIAISVVDIVSATTQGGYLTGNFAFNDPPTSGFGFSWLRLSTSTSTSGTGALDGRYWPLRIATSSGPTYTIIYKNAFNVSALSNGTDTYRVVYGITEVTTNAYPDYGYYFSYTHSDSSGQIVANMVQGGTHTNKATGITLAANTNYDLKIVINNGSASYYINNMVTPVATLSTNFPNSSTDLMSYIRILKSAGTTAVKLWTDNITYITDYP